MRLGDADHAVVDGLVLEPSLGDAHDAMLAAVAGGAVRPVEELDRVDDLDARAELAQPGRELHRAAGVRAGDRRGAGRDDGLGLRGFAAGRTSPARARCRGRPRRSRRRRSGGRRPRARGPTGGRRAAARGCAAPAGRDRRRGTRPARRRPPTPAARRPAPRGTPSGPRPCVPARGPHPSRAGRRRPSGARRSRRRSRRPRRRRRTRAGCARRAAARCRGGRSARSARRSRPARAGRSRATRSSPAPGSWRGSRTGTSGPGRSPDSSATVPRASPSGSVARGSRWNSSERFGTSRRTRFGTRRARSAGRRPPARAASSAGARRRARGAGRHARAGFEGARSGRGRAPSSGRTARGSGTRPRTRGRTGRGP